VSRAGISADIGESCLSISKTTPPTEGSRGLAESMAGRSHELQSSPAFERLTPSFVAVRRGYTVAIICEIGFHFLT
jgi:hypothetical protein